jgi:hypothetical protein
MSVELVPTLLGTTTGRPTGQRGWTEPRSSARVEQCRLSVVMLPPRSPALDREAAMAL